MISMIMMMMMMITYLYRVHQKRGHFVLRFVTLEVWTTSALNLAQINAMLFLT